MLRLAAAEKHSAAVHTTVSTHLNIDNAGAALPHDFFM